MVKAGLQGDLPLRLAGRRRREPRRAHLPRPEPLPGQQRARARPAPQQRAPARRPDRARRGQQRHPLARADRRRRRGRLRRAAERVRADEGDDRGRRRRRPLRGPARLREEVRPPRRQGARPDRASSSARSSPRGSPPTSAACRPSLVARTDALSATLLTSDVDERDAPFITGERTAEGFFRVRDGLEPAIARSLAYAPYADLLWFETSTPDLGEAREFAQAIHERFPGKLLAYNCSPSFNWRKHLDDARDRIVPGELAELGYRFQFVTLAGFHSLNAGHVRAGARVRGRGHDRLRRAPGARVRARGARLHRHAPPARGRRRLLRPVMEAVSGGASSTLALKGSTEEAQFAH